MSNPKVCAYCFNKRGSPEFETIFGSFDIHKICLDEAKTVNPEGYKVFFGKHRGKPISRVPKNYLEWTLTAEGQVINEIRPYSVAELMRRRESLAYMEIYPEAIDNGSLILGDTWRSNNENQDEPVGFHSWLVRFCQNALKEGTSSQKKNRRHVEYNNAILVFDDGDDISTLYNVRRKD